MADNTNSDSKRGLGAADAETRERVAREGGKASKGGFKTMDPKLQKKIASEGGQASHGGGRKAA